MLLFNAKFAVSDDLSRKRFLDMLVDYLHHDDRFSFVGDLDIDVSKKQKLESGSADAMRKFVLCITDTHFAVQLSYVQDSLVSTDTYVLTVCDDIPVMGVQLDRSLKYPSMNKDCFSDMPELVKRLFWEEYGGIDHGIMMDDKPYVIRKDQVELVRSIFAHEIELFNPVVYVTADLTTGEYPVDCQFLASRLVGLAHVFIEGSPPVASMVRDACPCVIDSGNILILFPSGEVRHLYRPDIGLSGMEINQQIIMQVHRIMASVMIEDSLSFSKIHMDYLLSENDPSDLSEVCDELLAEKDAETLALKKEIRELKSALNAAESKAASMSQALESKKSQASDPDTVSDHTITFDLGSERDLYPGECKDVVLKLIDREVDLMDHDRKLKQCRKFDVLSAISKQNMQTGFDSELSMKFCKAVESGTLTPESLSEIERLGFSVMKTKNSHFKIAYAGDVRYSCTAAATPSDFRSGDNLGKTYMNLLFGF